MSDIGTLEFKVLMQYSNLSWGTVCTYSPKESKLRAVIPHWEVTGQ